MASRMAPYVLPYVASGASAVLLPDSLADALCCISPTDIIMELTTRFHAEVPE